MIVRVGTRKSKLALIQTNLVIQKIQEAFPDSRCEIVEIVTTGDQITDKPLYDIGGKALFLKELEKALLEDEIDIAVHSLKDVPGRLPDGLEIAAVLEREDQRDALLSRSSRSISELRHGAVVGTSSVRRKVLLNKIRPDLVIVPLRGNVDSRIKKLEHGEMDATILAAAGLNRMGLLDPSYCHIIEPSEILPAIGQGAISIEIASGNDIAAKICAKINHQHTWNMLRPERAFIEYLDASCRTAMAGFTELLDDGTIKSYFMLSDFEGTKVAYHEEIGKLSEGHDIGIRAAKKLLLECS